MDSIELKHDIKLRIATAFSRKSKSWTNKNVKWSDLVVKFSNPVVTSETYKQFMNASKDDQGKIKDVGGFVGGYLEGGKRDKDSVKSRQVVALDIDNSLTDFWWNFQCLYDCAAAIHSTHKSSPEKPRHRLVIPLDREVTPDEYQAISRKIAEDLDINIFDQTTFDINRLMYWPSISRDVEFYFEYQDGPILKADEVLDRYNDWTDTSEWPVAANYEESILKALKKQEDPEEKKGIVGAFCRTYTIQEAIQEFLSDVYEECAIPDRYTYKNGSTSGGLVTYEDKFAYSHHDTDPASGRLCNAFDLVRIHKFGDQDTEKDKAKQETEKKSFKAMEEFAVSDARTKKTLATERLAEAKFDFAEGLEEEMENEGSQEDDAEWMQELETNTKGDYENSANNINLIMQNDKYLKDAFKLNIFDNKRYLVHSVPWRKIAKSEPIRDVDYAGIRSYIECVYGIVSNQKVDDAVSLEFEKKSFHPVRDYINSLEWDGKPRINTLLQEYFGAEDSVYTSAAIRKMLCAAVARVFEPGVKFDLVLILVGAQGTYKSTFISKLGGDFASDTFTTVQGKESFEQLQGAWLIEIAELSGLRKAEIESIKHYISKREDSFRPAYGRTVETFKRQCVFVGTTNNIDFLRDPTGNRRFMPVDVHFDRATKSVRDDLTQAEVDQIWAEAYQMWIEGEPLYLRGEEEMQAKIEQHRHSEMDDRRGVIERYLNTKLPKEWDTMDIYQRRAWLEDPNKSKEGVIIRDSVCIAEIWCECLRSDKSEMKRFNTKEINEILRTVEDWKYATSTKTFVNYGVQRYYKRVK